MAAKKGGLGKGLDALFIDNATEQAGETVYLKISEIEPNKGQPRKEFDESALADLTDSIAQHGILQPLLVRPLTGGTYQLVAGERRWRAARRAGLSEVPVIVREMADSEVMELALIENLQREDLNPIEEADGYRMLMDTHGLTQEEVSKKVNKSRPTVANALRLLNLPDSVVKMVSDGKLSAGQARTLLSFTNKDEILKAANMAANETVSVRELERMAKRSQREPQIKFPRNTARDSFYDEVELALTEAMGRKITVTEGKGKGLLEIEFYSKEDLKDIANQLAK